jgi:hypothetical protein
MRTLTLSLVLCTTGCWSEAVLPTFDPDADPQTVCDQAKAVDWQGDATSCPGLVKVGFYPCFSRLHDSWYCRDTVPHHASIENPVIYVFGTQPNEDGVLEPITKEGEAIFYKMNIDDPFSNTRYWDGYNPLPAVEFPR